MFGSGWKTGWRDIPGRHGAKMAVTTDIVQSWRNPRAVMRRHLARGRSEPWLFSLLVAFLVIVFVAQWPGAARASFFQPEVPVIQRLFATGLALLATIPFWYLLAAVSRLLSGLFGGTGDYYGARLALFWALLAVSPGMLLQGMVAGFIGPSPGLSILGVLVLGVFLLFWISMLMEAER
jgi:hypothetical protein